MVYRIYVEKKKQFADEAASLLSDIRSLLMIDSLEELRIFNRYDVENISEELFECCEKTVFSEPQLDNTYARLPQTDATVFAVEYLPGQFDQRADSCAQCIQIVSEGDKPTVRTAKVYMLFGKLAPAQLEAIKKYVINPVESREASLEKPETLNVNYNIPTSVETLTGFTERAKFVAEHYLENPVCFNTVRNMLGYTGTYKGRKLSVMGHGMGVPSAGLYAHELYNFYGVDTIIRIGSAGGIGEDVKVRDVVLAMGASTNSRFADQYRFPGQLCATADYGLLKDAAAAAERLGVRVDVGQVFTSDQFYNDNPEANATYRKFGILAVEMETAGIYWTAQRFGKRALSILTISDHIFTGEALSAQERQDSFHEMMEIALETAWNAAE